MYLICAAPLNGGKLKSVTRGQYLNDGDSNWVVDTTVALQTTRFEYNGTRTTVIDALGRKTTSVIDEYSLPLETIFEQRNGQNYSTKTSYLYTSNLQEAKDYPTHTIDIGGNDRAFTYDEVGRLKTATDLGNGTYSYSYSDDGLSQITGPTGETLGYGYDAVMGNLTSVIYGDGTTKQMSYRTEDNRLGTVTLQSGETMTYAYDVAGRMLSQTTKAADGTVTGTVSYTYTANGSMDTVTDTRTGVTDYDYDANTGALSQITYGNGSGVAYTYDLLGRTKTLTEWASVTGTRYTTTYEYDTFGNLKSVLDPADGLTTMKYDVGNRLTERSLPNGVKSTYQYDDLDRVQSITHTNAQGVVLASVTYERNGIGEPSKITREDGTFTRLEYDEALRVKKESFFSSTGTLVEETSYTYDAAGKRTATTTTAGTQTTSDTYNYTAGYQLDSVTGTTGADDYQFDANGRLTLIQRDGKTLDLNHDAQDRLTSVENETTGNTINYTYDAQGRRVAATAGNEVRQFLVAPTMGGGLESTDLIADGNGNLISNYVYAGGASPFMMLDAQGNPVYYLSDGMGSVIGLANGSGNEVGDFRYDSFGNVREQMGGAISSTGGDFRFQGQWLENSTGIYHFRARDYDAQTGTFLSRDPVDPTEQQPEAMNPYQFAYNNPHVYSDPTGMITSISELASANHIEKVLQGIRTEISSRAKQYLIDKAKGVAGDVVKSVVKSLLPTNTFDAVSNLDTARRYFRAGEEFEQILADEVCNIIGGSYSQFSEYVWLQPRVSTDGNPVDDGFACGSDIPDNRQFFSQRLFNPRPDFIIKDGGPRTTDYARNSQWSKSFLIGDVKLSGSTVAGRINSNQWNAIMNYAKYGNRHQYTPVALYITFWGATPGDRTRVERAAWRNGVSATIVSILPGARS